MKIGVIRSLQPGHRMGLGVRRMSSDGDGVAQSGDGVAQSKDARLNYCP